MESLVSVIITTYKGVDTIERTILSIINQDYSNIEVIVVDDNGLGTEEQIHTRDIVSKYNSVQYIAHETNQNGSVARNTGAKASSGNYLCFVDDDDVFYPNKIRLQVEKFSQVNEDCALVYCSFKEIRNNSEEKTYYAEKRGEVLLYSLLDEVKIATSLFMIKREAYLAVGGFDESFRRHQDWEFVARVASMYQVDFVPEVCVMKYSIARNSAKNPQMMEEYRIHYLNKMDYLIRQQAKRTDIICYHYLCFVKEYVKLGNYKKFFEYMIKSKAPIKYCSMFFRDFIKSINK